MTEALTLLWVFINSPVGMLLIAAIVSALGAKKYLGKPEWAEWEGTIIAGIKMAEKAIPDDTENKGRKRLDKALKYVLAIYAMRELKPATAKTRNAFLQGVQIKHDQLEAEGTLHGNHSH